MKIEEGVPIPPKQVSKMKYGLHLLETGHSIFFKTKEPQKVQMRMLNATRGYKVKHPEAKFTTRALHNGVRIWKIS